MKKKTVIITVLSAILVLAVIAAAILGYYRSHYIVLNGQGIARDAESLSITAYGREDLHKIAQVPTLRTLDLRDTQLSVEEFEELQQALPECEISWQIPFEGQRLDCKTEVLAMVTPTEEDWAALPHFKNLKNLDATAIDDYPRLMELQERRPEVSVQYCVTLGDRSLMQNATIIQIQGASPEELMVSLAYLPELESVTLTDDNLDPYAMLALQEQYSHVSFRWKVNLFGQSVPNTVQNLDLSGIPMENTEELESLLPCFTDLRTVKMIDCGVSNEDMESLNLRHPETLFVWTVQIGQMTLRTDITEFMPTKLGYPVQTKDCPNLRYLTELEGLDLGHMYISDCEFVRNMPHLKYLILADTNIKDISPLTGLKELKFLELFMTPVKDFTPLLTLTALDDLNISYLKGDPKIIGQMTWLKRLWWVASSYGAPEYLREALPNTRMQFTGLSSTCNGWRTGGQYFNMRDCFGMPYAPDK